MPKQKEQSDLFKWSAALTGVGVILMGMSGAMWVGLWIMEHANSVMDWMLYTGGVIAFVGFILCAFFFEDPDKEEAKDDQ